jgi:hypothetical protein
MRFLILFFVPDFWYSPSYFITHTQPDMDSSLRVMVPPVSVSLFRLKTRLENALRPQPNANNRTMKLIRGKMLGGCR